ncbi:MAG: patatin-like phospholipase family protein [Candidatus Methylomirabilales bacterium]
MKLLRFVFVWGRRIPVRFTLSFIILMLIYLVSVSWLVEAGRVTTVVDLLWKLLGFLGVPASLGEFAIVKVFFEGLVVVFILLLGILASYNVSAWAYQWLRQKPRLVVHGPVLHSPGIGTRLDGFERIGIILAGGGAKGAYQAGAMKAIHEFLEQNNALHKVRMIAGTSIGSWNAMFWLAGLIKPRGPTEMSLHEEWWRTISISRIVEFDTYWPLRRNHFVLSTPWQETFRRIFVETPEVRDRMARLFVPGGGDQDPPVHFYLTRSNVERGHLEFSTNWPGIRTLSRPNLRTADPDDVEPVVRPDRCEVIERDDIEKALARTAQAVFASMDLPPLFPYMKIKVEMEEWFEDGGVVENIPVWFGVQIEQCDLLFILPLNASFAERANHTSVTKRLFRVMDVRQGVLERNAMKLAYLYNELAALRSDVERLSGGQGRSDRPPKPDLKARALLRRHKPISVFSICPRQPLTVGTAEFWKPQEAGQAFDLMYAATKYELAERFEEDVNPNWIRMTLVSPVGERTYTDDF